MTRKEVTGIRDLGFSNWVRNKLPDSSTGYSASDLDFMLWNWKTKKIILLEIKTRKAIPRKGQHEIFKLINKWMKRGIDKDWKYLGFHLIQFENDENFDNGKCYLNHNEISEIDLINFLSLL
jgi:hypothetical protein